MGSIQIKSWQILPSEGGEALAFSGDRVAVSGPSRLCVWRGKTRLATVDAPSPAPGVPRFAGERVYWGPGFVDLTSGEYIQFKVAQPAVWPGGGENSHVYAWSPQGDLLLGAFSTGDPLRPVRVTLFSWQTGAAVATLWEGNGLPAQTAWLGEHAVMVGFSELRVFTHSGAHLADITLGGAPISSIESTTSERRLIAVELNQAIVWINTETWTVLDRWPGPWLYGAVSPDGRFVAVLEPWGKLHFACLEGDRFKPVGHATVDPKAIALAFTFDEIATVGGGEVHRANLKVNCTTVAAP